MFGDGGGLVGLMVAVMGGGPKVVFGRYSFIVVVFNASPKEVSFVSPALQLRNLQLHPIQVQIKLKYLNVENWNISKLCFEKIMF